MRSLDKDILTFLCGTAALVVFFVILGVGLMTLQHYYDLQRIYAIEKCTKEKE